MLLSVLISTITSPTITLAEEVSSQVKTEEVDKSEGKEEVKQETTEKGEPKSIESEEAPEIEISKEETLDSTAKANDSPKVVDEEEIVKPATKVETDSVDLDKINELAKRPFPQMYDTSGLTNAEIEQLGLAIIGEYQPAGTTTTMKNDAGEEVAIPFKVKREARAIGTSSGFNMSYTLSGFGTTSSFPSMAHHYMDGKYSYCIDPNYMFYPGSNYVGNPMDISNATYKNVNDVLNFGAKDGSDEVAAGYTQLLVWARIGWDVTAVGGVGSLSGFKAYQADVEKKMQQWYAKPSFDNQTVTLNVGESITLTDTNNGINPMDIISNTTGTTVTKTGNKVTIKATSATNTDGNIVFKKDTPLSDTPLIWTSPGSQSNVTGGKLDPSSILSTIKIKIIQKGNLLLKKVDDTGKAIAGAEFNLIAEGKTTKATTNSNGELATPDYNAGTVVQYEETKAPAGHYIDPATSKGSVTLKEGTNAIKVTNPRFANLTLIKKNDKGLDVEGAEFNLRYNGKDHKVKTNSKGALRVENELKAGTTVEWEELKTIKGHYIDPENSKGTIVVKSGENTINVENPTLNIGLTSQAHNQDGAQFANPTKGQKLSDEVMIQVNQGPANAKYRLTNDLLEFGTGKQLGEESLKQVIEFEANQAQFVKVIEREFDATGMHGKKGVHTNILEYYNPSTEEWEEVARDDDLNNEAQAIQFVQPTIHTEFFFYDHEGNETKITDPLKKAKGYDRVYYENLISGQTYKFDLTMMNRETGKEFLDPNGNKVTGMIEIVAGKDGEVTSTISAKEYYENLAKEAEEKDGDKDKEEMTDKEDSEEPAESEIKPLAADEEEANNQENAETEGTEETEDPTEFSTLNEIELLTGHVDVPFEADLSAANGNILVAYEQVSTNETPVAEHKDIEDEKQSGKVRNPELNTKALVNGVKEVTEDGKLVLEDTVEYSDLTPGVEYEQTVVWMVKNNGEALKIKQKEVTGTVKFTPEKEDGEVTVKVVIDGKELFENYGDTVDLVAFEETTREGEKIAEHKDINDEGQTVRINKPVVPVSKRTLPQTSGSESNPTAWIMLALVIAVGAIFVFVNKKRQKNRN